MKPTGFADMDAGRIIRVQDSRCALGMIVLLFWSIT